MMLSDVCLSAYLSVAYIGPKSRTERPRKTKVSRGSPRHTWLGHHFQGQKVNSFSCCWPTILGHQAALLTTVLARQAAAAVGVGTCWPWETAPTLPSARRRKALRRPRGRRGAGAYRGGRPPAYSLYKLPKLWGHRLTNYISPRLM